MDEHLIGTEHFVQLPLYVIRRCPQVTDQLLELSLHFMCSSTLYQYEKENIHPFGLVLLAQQTEILILPLIRLHVVSQAQPMMRGIGVLKHVV